MRLKTFIRYFIAISVVIFFSVLTLIYFTLQPEATTVQVNQINANSAQKSQQLVKRIGRTLKQSNHLDEISMSQHEVNGLTALLHRAFPKVISDVKLSSNGAAAAISVALPLPQFIRFLNVKSSILPSEEGVLIDTVTIGGLSISGEFFLSIVGFTVDLFVQNKLVDKALSLVSSVDINEQRIVTKLNKSALSINNHESMLIALRDDLALFGDVETISFYYQQLSDFASQQNHHSSIATFIGYLFEQAKVQTNISANDQAVNENQAAMMALVIYFGADKFELLVGDIIIRERQQLIVRNRMRRSVTLQGRVDLQKHFIYSMALQLFSTHGASDAIGEFKEFLDTNKGGSGFSFADLQADRAGTRLAMVVTKSEHQAEKAQVLLSNVTDQQLLPSIEGLQEGLTEASFKKEFNNVESTNYQQTLVEINSRLKSLAVYQLGWE